MWKLWKANQRNMKPTCHSLSFRNFRILKALSMCFHDAGAHGEGTGILASSTARFASVAGAQTTIPYYLRLLSHTISTNILQHFTIFSPGICWLCWTSQLSGNESANRRCLQTMRGQQHYPWMVVRCTPPKKETYVPWRFIATEFQWFQWVGIFAVYLNISAVPLTNMTDYWCSPFMFSKQPADVAADFIQVPFQLQPALANRLRSLARAKGAVTQRKFPKVPYRFSTVGR